MVRIARWLLALVLLALPLSACGLAPRSSEPLRVIVPIWMGFTPLYAAENQHFFGSTPVAITSIGSLYDANRAFTQGRADVLATTLFDALRIADSGVPIKVILVSDYSKGADAIVARPGIASMSDLKGKRVAVEVGTLAHFFMISALEHAGVNGSDVEVVNLAAEDAVQALQNGKVDAIEIWEPYLSQLTTSGKGKQLFTTAEIPGLFADVLVVRKDLAEQRAADVTNLVSAWGKAMQAWQKQPQNVLPAMAKAMSATPEQFQADLATVQLLDLSQNQQLFDRAHDQSVWRAYDETAGFLNKHNFLKNPPTAAQDILDVQFVNQAVAQ
jgi:NitT/TauT family transport system substrate-binding protein